LSKEQANAISPVPVGLASRALKSRSFVIGASIALLVAFAALLSFVWTPYDVTKLVIADRLKMPGGEFWLGTDHFGRDIFSMIMVGARNSLAVALVAVGIGMAIGVPLGALAAARGGWLDDVVMRGNDLIFAFPSILSAVMITAVFGPGAINAIIAIGIFNIPVFARLTRGAALSLWTRDYVLAAQVCGKTKTRITIEHILPNISNLLIVQGTIQFSLGILAEAGLSYVGLGAQPPMPSWGRMLFEAQTMMSIAPHMAIIPGIAIILTVLGLNLMGDGMRDALDPKLRGND
jgi:peptide/nickel transport system permease protein